jgi:hypothetical protein
MPLAALQAAQAHPASAREEVPPGSPPAPLGGSPRVAFGVAVLGAVALFGLLMLVRKLLGTK